MCSKEGRCCCGQAGDAQAGSAAINNDNRSCGLCQPYRDALLVACQVISIVAFCASWIFWATMLLGGTVMVLLQVMWCCRVSLAGIIAAIVLSTLAAMTSLVFAIFALVNWSDESKTYCSVFTLTDDFFNDDFYVTSDIDYCNEVAWSVVGFVVMALWASVAIMLIHFVRSGRYRQCMIDSSERLIRAQINPGGNNGGDIELAASNTNANSIESAPPPYGVVQASRSTAAIAGAQSPSTTIPAATFIFENEDYGGLTSKIDG